MEEKKQIIEFINKFSTIYNNKYFNGDPYAAITKFKNGQCYQFALKLQEVFPNAILYINNEGNHVVSKIGESLYDITAMPLRIDGYHEMDDMDYLEAEFALQDSNKVTREKQNMIIEQIMNEVKEQMNLNELKVGMNR